MPGGHIAERLQAYLAGTLAPSERAVAESHLTTCAECRDERDLLAAALSIMRPLPAFEPRAGFAARVALNARDTRAPFAQWLRFSLGGLAVACAAGLAVVATLPAHRHSDEVMVAQRLDLFEDLAVVQHQQSLEDLEVVEVLHTLGPEARP
jgi:anti-sigma factor RsiW